MITTKELREQFNYDPETGVLTRRVRTSNRIKVGDVVGQLRKDGYLQANAGGKMELVHRLIWTYLHGEIPEGMEIDHANMVRNDNRAHNLRLATRSDNLHNTKKRSHSKSQFKNVQQRADNGRWRARIVVGGRRLSLGAFASEAAATLAFTVAAEKYHREFARAV